MEVIKFFSALLEKIPTFRARSSEGRDNQINLGGVGNTNHIHFNIIHNHTSTGYIDQPLDKEKKGED